MLHKKRIWNVKEIEDPVDLANKLTNYTWTGCTGFKLRNILFLNDSTCADGAQEYAVVLDESGYYYQIESITFSWCTFEEALNYIYKMIEYSNTKPPFKTPVEINLNHGKKCYLCM